MKLGSERESGLFSAILRDVVEGIRKCTTEGPEDPPNRNPRRVATIHGSLTRDVLIGVVFLLGGFAMLLTGEEKVEGWGLILMLFGLYLVGAVVIREVPRIGAAIRRRFVGDRGTLGVVMILVGAGLFIYGILGFQSYRGGSGWSTEARLEVLAGAVLLIGGSLLYKTKK